MCCLKITYQIIDGGSGVIQVEPDGTLNGFNTYTFVIDGVTYYIWHDSSDNWKLTTSVPGDGSATITGIKNTMDECPFASIPTWLPNDLFDEFTTEQCDACPCLNVTIVDKFLNSQVYFVTQTDAYNGYPAYQFAGNPLVPAMLYLWFDSSGLGKWVITDDGFGGSNEIVQLKIQELCPQGLYDILPNAYDIVETTISGVPCECVKREDRQKFEYKAIRFPEIFVEQNRGLKDCCCKFMVLAGGGTESWKNDKTSAWIKLSDFADTVTFTLKKNGIPTSYTPTIQAFPNEDNAFYTTIEWKDVLISDGSGCYSLDVEFNISGASGLFTWGIYNLQPYTIQNALKTARVRAKFNGYHEIEGIDFTGANVESTHRFYGFIGNRQPNTEIDNIIYSNREMKRVIRENLNDYEIITDPEDECIIKPLVDLYLLSENELYISDYNAHNHSYRYLDIPVIVKESPEIEYKELSRKAVLTCKVEDKFKNKRTLYNG